MPSLCFLDQDKVSGPSFLPARTGRMVRGKGVISSANVGDFSLAIQMIDPS